MTAVIARRRTRRTRTAAACARPAAAGEVAASREPTLFDDRPQRADAEPTLDELVSGLWDGVVARQQVACPLCDGELAPAISADGRVLGGRCEGCGTTLA